MYQVSFNNKRPHQTNVDGDSTELDENPTKRQNTDSMDLVFWAPDNSPDNSIDRFNFSYENEVFKWLKNENELFSSTQDINKIVSNILFQVAFIENNSIALDNLASFIFNQPGLSDKLSRILMLLKNNDQDTVRCRNILSSITERINILYFQIIPLDIFWAVFRLCNKTSLGRLASTNSNVNKTVKEFIGKNDKFFIGMLQASRYFYEFENEVTYLNINDSDQISNLIKFKRLTHLCIGDYRLFLTENCMKYVSTLTNLQSFSLPKSKIDDKDIALLATLTNLNTLKLGKSDITNLGFEQLKDLRQLTCLSINKCNSFNSLTAICNQFQLKHLEYTNCLLLKDITCITGLTCLEYLSFSGSRLDYVSYNHLSALTTLKYLDLEGSFPFDVSLAPVKTLLSLEYLNLKECLVPNKEFIHLIELTNLRQLSVGDYGLEVEINHEIANLGNLTRLENVNLGNRKLTDNIINKFSENKKITSLIINGRALTQKGIESISNMINLEILHIMDGYNISEGFKKLGKLTNLRDLKIEFHRHFNTKPLDDSDLNALSRLTKLETLNLQHFNFITQLTFNNFIKNTKLHERPFIRLGDKSVVCSRES
jgi:Leucine-rich repeat (LRR) protein